MYRFISAILLIIAVSSLALFVYRGTTSLHSSQKPRVVATFYPLAFLAREIGGDKVQITTIVPPGAEPHDFEPSLKDIAKLYKADLFIYLGVSVDSWANKLSSELSKKNVTLVSIKDTGIIQKDDPHIWLDPILMKKVTAVVAEALSKRDPAHRAYYEKQARIVSGKMDKLDTVYKDTLSTCRLDTIISSHDAFAYLGRRYGFKIVPITGLSPEEEPSAKRLAQTAELVKQYKIPYIFFETLVSPRLAETIAKETGAKTQVLNPIEGLTKEEEEKGKNYYTVSGENAVNLGKALICTPKKNRSSN